MNYSDPPKIECIVCKEKFYTEEEYLRHLQIKKLEKELENKE